MIGLALALGLLAGDPGSTSVVQQTPPPAQCRPDAQGATDWRACADATPKRTANHALAMMNLGTEAYLQGDFTGALRFYDEAEIPGQSITGDVLFQTFRADARTRGGRAEDGLADAQLAWRMIKDPTLYPSPGDMIELNDEARLYVLGLLLPILHHGDPTELREARAAYDAITPQDWRQFGNRAAVLEQVDDLSAAAVASKQALDMAPTADAAMLNNHCYILVRLARAAEALGYCERAVAASDTYGPEGGAAFRHSYASALAALGRCADAEAQLADAHRLNPADPLYTTPLTCTAKR